MLSMPGWPRARQAHSALPRLPCSRRPAREQGPITAARRLLQASRAVRLDDLLPGPEPMPALAVGPAAGDGQDAQPVPPVAAEARVLAGAVRQLVPAVLADLQQACLGVEALLAVTLTVPDPERPAGELDLVGLVPRVVHAAGSEHPVGNDRALGRSRRCRHQLEVLGP